MDYIRIKKITIEIFNILQKNNISDQAAILAYISLLSLVPALGLCFILLSTLTPLLNSDGKILIYLQEFILNNLTKGSGEDVLLYLRSVLSSFSLQKLGVISLLSMSLTLGLLLQKIEVTLNQIWQGAQLVDRTVVLGTMGHGVITRDFIEKSTAGMKATL